MSSRLWIGMITFYVLAIVICNVIEGAQMTTGISTDMTPMTQYSQTKSTDSAGNTADFWTVGASTLATIGKVVTFDYSVFKDYDPGTGTSTANDFVIFRYLLIAIGAVMIFELILALRQVISK
jgi:hypothetical protein